MRQSIQTTHPKIARQFDKSKNSLSIEEITYGSSYKVYWICSKNHSWIATPKERTRKKNQRRCSVCRSLDFNYTDLIKEWDFKKNKIDPKILYAGGIAGALLLILVLKK